MTDNRIIKMLESRLESLTDGYEAYLTCRCEKDLCTEAEIEELGDIIDLINRQKAEIERYREVVGELGVKDGKVVALLNGKETEYIQKSVADTLKKMAVRSAKDEVVREFAQRMKSYYLHNKAYGKVTAHTDVGHIFLALDELVEEMVGNNNDKTE